MTSDKMEIETNDRELIFTRVFDGPRELVFETFTACSHLEHWWGPREWPLSTCEMDFREGGVWTYCMQGPDDQLACGQAVYKRIKRPELIEYEDFFLDEGGEINHELPSALSTFTFADHDGKTKLTGRTRYAEASDLQQVLDMGVIEGMTETLDRLDEHLARIQGRG